MNRDQKRQLAAIFATNIALEITFVSGNVSGPAFQRAFGLSDTQLGFALGAVHLGLISVALFVGKYTHRHGPPRVLSVGLIGAVVGSVVVVAAGGFGLLFAGLAALGVSAALITNANATFVSEIAGKNVRRAMALASGLWFLSSAVSAPGIGAWITYGRGLSLGAWSHRIVYLFDILLILACFVFVRRVVVRRRRAAVPRSPGSEEGGAELASSDYRTPLNPEWPWVPVAGFLHGLFIVILLAWTNPMLQTKFGATDWQGGLGVGLVSLGIGGGRFALASLRAAVDDRYLLAGSGVVGGALLTVALFAQSLAVTYGILFVAGLACSLTFPTILSLVGTRFPRSRSRMFGYMEASISTAGIAGPAAVGLLADAGVPTWHAMLVSPAAGFVLAVTAVVWLVARPGQPTSP